MLSFLWWRFKIFYDGFSWNQVYIRILGIRGESATYRILWANKCQSKIRSLIYTEIFNVKAKSWSPLGKQILKDFKLYKQVTNMKFNQQKPLNSSRKSYAVKRLQCQSPQASVFNCNLSKYAQNLGQNIKKTVWRKETNWNFVAFGLKDSYNQCKVNASCSSQA